MPKTLPARVARRWERIKICFMPDDYVRHFPCPLCGVKCPVPVYLVEEYAGRKVTRWCEACRQLIDLQVPPKEDAVVGYDAEAEAAVQAITDRIMAQIG